MPEQPWKETENGTLEATFTELDAAGRIAQTFVALPDESLINLRLKTRKEWQKDGADVTGWKFEVKGVRYTVIDDRPKVAEGRLP